MFFEAVLLAVFFEDVCSFVRLPRSTWISYHLSTIWCSRARTQLIYELVANHSNHRSRSSRVSSWVRRKSAEKGQTQGVGWRGLAWLGVAWRGLGRLGRKMEDEAWLNQGGANNSRNSDNSLQQGFLFMSMLAKSKCQEASEFTQIQCHATEFLFVAFLCFLWIVGMAVGSWGWCNPKSYNIHNWAWQVSTTGVLRLRRLPGAMKIAS